MSPTPTHEHEITTEVDLCRPGGKVLSPAARGWSRTPLHTCTLAGRWGRTKRWDYWAVLAGDHVLSVVYGDVDYLGMAEVWWVDLTTGATGGRSVAAPLGRGLSLPDRPGTTPLRFRGRHLDLDIVDEPAAASRGAGQAGHGTTRLRARWDEADGGRPATADVTVALPPGHESLNVVVPWSDRLFQYTSKHQARPATGTVEVGDDRWELGEAWGVLDVGRGRWPYRTRWNWGGGAGVADTGSVVGIQIGGQWTEGTGFTENGVIVDGRLTKIGAELEWTYDWDAPMEPWRVVDPHGHLDITLTPRFDKHTGVKAVVAQTEVHQVFGTWSGWVATDDGTVHRLDGAQGFAEESRSRW
ncbi:DUF2804 domain-containing protein [Iamia sp. SCSIO 61187]|uniref:DUF2804 domain-containing protein n=1 Tax=Iamia sp. SCSIO 61187 TaxID=2722752 RepID=UPI001C6255F2|nr:DUF2804 domain-containing protein [Iamia sp. SCSIO 61187]QYG92192.1 DUF2804 domain-containing protein [Iamia sp. SCSIO 61187]